MRPANKPSPALPSDYPDVLGSITGGRRHNMGVLQCAFAVYPRAAAIGQPLEALLLLQNMCDKQIQLHTTLHLPRKDAAGQRLALVAAKEQVTLTMQPGEVGLLHMPVVPYTPTQPSRNNMMSVKVEARAAGKYHLVRHAEGGRAPAALNVSPVRLNILRGVGFSGNAAQPGVLSAPFDIVGGQIPNVPATTVHYDALWTDKEWAAEQAMYQQQVAAAEQFAESMVSSIFMPSLIATTDMRFGAAGMPLHRGEAIYIAKAVGYVLEEGLEIEEGFSLQTSRWFQRLVPVMNDRAMIDDMDRLIGHLYTAAVHDAVRVGLMVVERLTKQNLGTQTENTNYADEIVTALETYKPLDLGHIYWPLVLAGLHFNMRIKAHKENAWESFTLMQEAWQTRVNQTGSTFGIIGEALAELFTQEEDELRRMRVPRP